MNMISDRTIDLVNRFVEENRRGKVLNQLQDYCNYLKENDSVQDEYDCDRLCFAILKLSKGSEDKFKRAMELARQDYRDLLVSAKFANSTTVHNNWYSRVIINE